MQMRPVLTTLALVAGLFSSAPLLAAPPTAAEVGDADSFGKKVIWIGLANTGGVSLRNDCTPNPGNPLGPDDRCVVLTPNALTPFNFPDLGRITLPGNSVKSLICHWATPTITYSFQNSTALPAVAQFRSNASYRIESEVLQDPSLINPGTAAPFAGGFDVSIPIASEFKTLAAGAVETHRILATRTCIAGLVTKASLVLNYGLTEAQAKKFFQRPVTIKVGTNGAAIRVSNASVLISTRFTGDE